MNVEKVKMLGIGAVIIAAAHCLANTASSAPVAMVTDIQGKGLIVSQSETGDLALLSQLAVGDEVELDDASRLIMVYLNSADEFDIAGPATFASRPTNPKFLAARNPRDGDLVSPVTTTCESARSTQRRLRSSCAPVTTPQILSTLLVRSIRRSSIRIRYSNGKP